MPPKYLSSYRVQHVSPGYYIVDWKSVGVLTSISAGKDVTVLFSEFTTSWRKRGAWKPARLML